MNNSEKVSRNIYYYDVAAITGDENGKTVKNQAGIIRNAFKYIRKINELVSNCTDKDLRKETLQQIVYKTIKDDNIYFIVDEIEDAKPIKFRMVLCRLGALPYIEKNGQLTNITSEVKGDFTVAEITHCVMFPEAGIMGAEFNFNGARPSTIVSYIPKVYTEIPVISCHGKLRNDAFERLAEDKDFSLFELAVKNTENMRVVLRDQMGLIGAFFNTIPDIDVYEIRMKRRKGKRKAGFQPPATLQEIQSIVNEHHEDIEKFKVSQGVYADSVDLLKDKMVCTQEFVITENKAIDSDNMYNVIMNFYNEVISKNDDGEENEN